MDGIWKDLSKPWIQTGQFLQTIGNGTVNRLVETVTNVRDAVASTGDLVLGIPVGAIGSYSHGNVSTCGNRDKLVSQIRHRACRLLHGSYSWLATAAAKTVSFGQSTPIQHEWIEISTDTHYYIVQIWVDGNIVMEQKTSLYEVDQTGLHCANKANDSDVWTISTHSVSTQLGNVIDWLNSKHFTPSYHWSQHNCQHFCKAFLGRF